MPNSFHSFVKYDEGDKSEINIEENHIAECTSRTLLPGEIESASCEDVTFWFQFQEQLRGKISCTNFCLFFQPFVTSGKRPPRRFTAFDEQFCIPLCSIENIYYAVNQPKDLEGGSLRQRKKFKLLKTSFSYLDIVSSLKLFLKDFRVVTIDLSRSQHVPCFVNQLLIFSKYSPTMGLIQTGANFSWNMKIAFNDEDAWNKELQRCGVGGKEFFRVCNVRQELCHYRILSYPMYVVVPRNSMQHELGQMAEHWNNGRFPVWVWSHRNGAALMRSSSMDDSWNGEELKKRYINNLKFHMSGAKEAHRFFKIERWATPEYIANSYRKLAKLFSIDSEERFQSTEKDYLTRFSDSEWPYLIWYCLSSTADVMKSLVNKNKCVTISEENGQDFSAVISSLVQICCDPFCRTTTGLDNLISKDWIAMGHPFGERLQGIADVDAGRSCAPTFLLFLDCVAQLIRLYPVQFCYSQHMLIALWDVALTGCVPGFACSSVEEQLASKKCGGPFPLDRFFSKEYRSLFSNCINDASQLTRKIARNHYASSPGGSPAPLELLGDIIRPPTSAIDIECWDLCFLRWSPVTTVENGGAIQRDIRLDAIMEMMANRSNSYWNSELSSLRNDETPISSAYPYSLPEVAKPRASSDVSDADSIISFNAISLKDHSKPRLSLPYSNELTPVDFRSSNNRSNSIAETITRSESLHGPPPRPPPHATPAPKNSTLIPIREAPTPPPRPSISLKKPMF